MGTSTQKSHAETIVYGYNLLKNTQMGIQPGTREPSGSGKVVSGTSGTCGIQHDHHRHEGLQNKNLGRITCGGTRTSRYSVRVMRGEYSEKI